MLVAWCPWCNMRCLLLDIKVTAVDYEESVRTTYRMIFEGLRGHVEHSISHRVGVGRDLVLHYRPRHNKIPQGRVASVK